MTQHTQHSMQVELTRDREVEIWESLADQFLDSEERPSIPFTARLLVESGLSIDAAFAIWRDEVVPVVWTNAWDVAGVWGAWNMEVLAPAIREQKARRWRWPWPLNYLIYRLRVHLLHSYWRSIARCMALLEATPPEARLTLTRQLGMLARAYFEMGAPDPETLDPAQRGALRALYPQTFKRVFGPAILTGESFGPGPRRVRKLLSGPALGGELSAT